MRWIEILAFVGLALAATPAGAMQETNDAERVAARAAIEEGLAAIKAGQPQAAIASVEPQILLLERDATRGSLIFCGMSGPETILYMGMAAAKAQSAVAIGPELCDALFVKAFALIDLDQVDAAQAIFQRLTELAPMHASFLSELGNSYRLQRNWQTALDTYERAERAAEFAPDEDKASRRCLALRGQGYMLVEQGKFDAAEAAYRKCLAVIPDEPKSLGELAYIAEQRRK